MEKAEQKDILGAIVAETVQLTSNVLESPEGYISDNTPEVVQLRRHFKDLPEGLRVEETRNEVHLFATLEGFSICIVVFKDKLSLSVPYVPANRFLFITDNGEHCVDLNQILRKAYPNAREGIHMDFLNPDKFPYFASRTCGFPTSLEDIFAIMHEYGHQARRGFTDGEIIEMNMPFPDLLPTIVEDETESWDIAHSVLCSLRNSKNNFVRFSDEHFYSYRETALKAYDDFHRKNLRVLSRLSPRYRFTVNGKAETLRFPELIRSIINIIIDKRRKSFEQSLVGSKL